MEQQKPRTFVITDAMNLFFRAKHVVRGTDIDTKIGMAMHIIFSSINKSFKDFGGDHVVVCFEGSSWRKKAYAPYKRNRAAARAALTEAELEEDACFFEAFNDFKTFLETKTNCTILQHPNCEADDMIARWIQTHQDDNHVIVSSDSDFFQLLAPNVSQYNGVTNQHITIEGVFDDRGKPVKDKKTGEQKQIGDPEWLLFEKCVRGDTSDNIFSAYPGARKKGTKNKVGLLEAFDDRNAQGYNWNNFMLQRWVDADDNEIRVLDAYNRNKELIDLTAQPAEIKEAMDEVISSVTSTDNVPVSQVGAKFMKFCGKYDLIKVAQASGEHARYLNAVYPK